MKKVTVIFFSLAITSCTSALKKVCNETNWFSYGETVAMRGDRLTGDDFIKSCEKEEADVDHSALDLGFKKGMSKYCTSEQAYLTGKSGDPFSEEMCESGKVKTLKARHHTGILEYCAKENGYRAGGSGKKYKNICPLNLEKEFLPEYNRGRRQYLSVLVTEKEKEINQISEETNHLKKEQERIRNHSQFLKTKKRLTEEQSIDPVTHQVRRGTKWVADEQAIQEANSLDSKANQIASEISVKQRRLDELRKDITEHNLEKAGL